MRGRKGETPADSAAIRAELGRVIAALSGSERLRQFISFIVEETLQGRSDQIKEYVIGVQVYGKPALYDPRTDSTVRVEASRLRARLQQYYETEGASSRILITIPKGGYVPAFGARKGNQQFVAAGPAARWIVLASVAALGLGLTLSALTILRKKSPGAIPLPMSLTTYKGQQKAPALSPDGTRVAFSWDGPDEGRFSIYVKPLDSPNPVRLTNDNTTDDNYPAWSPDGRWIAFYRNTGENGAVYLVASDGGRETRLTPGQGDSLVWTRDGLGVIVGDRESGSKPLAAYLVLLKNGERRQITHPPDDAIEDHCFSISPDGKSLVFARMTGSSVSDLYMAPLAGDRERRLTYLKTWIFGSAFLPDGHSLLVAAKKSDAPNLWRLSLDTAEQELISEGPALLPSAVRSRSGRGISVAFQRKATSTIMIEIDPATLTRREIAPSTRLDTLPQYSPDGERIAFASNREGPWAVFVCNRSGSISRKIDPLPEYTSVGAPRWSPDGRHIAYDSRAGDHRQHVVVVDLETGGQQLLVSGPGDNFRPSWSGDGRWVYFSSTRGGSSQIWKIPATGGEAAPVTKNGGFEALESGESQALYYIKNRQEAGLWRTLPNGGPEAPVCQGAGEGRWTITRDAIYFIDPAFAEKGSKRLKRCDPATGRETDVLSLDQGAGVLQGLSVSAAGHILYTSQTTRSELMMIDGLR
jgi:Tol biopolymer transport system component